MITYFALDASTAPLFQTLVSEQMQAKLLMMAPDTLAFGVMEEGRPVGIALAELHPESSLADLTTLFVDPTIRNRGIGRLLLAHLEESLRKHHCNQLVTEFLIEKQQEEQTERFLRGRGFRASEQVLHVFTGEISRLEELLWFQTSKLPEPFSIFPWRELKAEERTEIQKGQDVWYPAILSPFQQEERVDVDLSVGLRYRGEVVGWLILQRLARNLVLFKSMFVKSEFQRMGRGIAMGIEMVRQTQLPQEIPFAMIVIEHENEAMLQIVRKRFEPLLLWEKVVRRTDKILETKTSIFHTIAEIT